MLAKWCCNRFPCQQTILKEPLLETTDLSFSGQDINLGFMSTGNTTSRWGMEISPNYNWSPDYRIPSEKKDCFGGQISYYGLSSKSPGIFSLELATVETIKARFLKNKKLGQFKPPSNIFFFELSDFWANLLSLPVAPIHGFSYIDSLANFKIQCIHNIFS